MNTMTASSPRREMNWANALVAFLVLGNLSMTRSFAHIGYAPVYVGEASLLALLLSQRGAVVWSWFNATFRPNLLSGVAWCLFISAGYGLMESIRGIAYGYGCTAVLQNVVLHVYPLFFFVGVGVGVRNAEFLPRLIRALAWWHGIYGVMYIFVLGQYETPDDIMLNTVAWFGQPHGAGVCLIALVALKEDLRRVWLPVLLNVVVLLGMQMRAAWLSLIVAMLMWGYLTGRLRQLLRLGAVVVAVFAVAAVTDLHYSAPACRGGDISARHILGRAVAAVDERAAELLTGSVDDAKTYHGNVNWRTAWWWAIYKKVHHTPLQAAFGLGYGYPIWGLHPLDDLVTPVRTPHNSYMYALGYTGWVGLTIFCALQLALARLLWLVYQRTGQTFGLCLWGMAAVWACFDGFFETPFSAIALYLLLGLAAAPALRSTPCANPDTGQFSALSVTMLGEPGSDE